MRISLDPVAWQCGYDAGYTTDPHGAMPPTPAGDGLAWASGFVEGRAARLALDGVNDSLPRIRLMVSA